MIEINKTYLGDCLELMKKISDKSIDMILCDLPYNTTRAKWDEEIDLVLLWEQYERIIKDEGAIILTACQPFTSKVILSNIKLFKYNWIWEKSRGSNCIHSKFQPLKVHEEICVFSKTPAAQNKKWSMKYNPVMTEGKPYNKGQTDYEFEILQGTKFKKYSGENSSGLRFPRSVIYFSSDSDGKMRGLHPTQKPVILFEYLIKTYTNENDLVLDNCAGSGTTAIACINVKRNYILMEKEQKYFDVINERINHLLDD